MRSPSPKPKRPSSSYFFRSNSGGRAKPLVDDLCRYDPVQGKAAFIVEALEAAHQVEPGSLLGQAQRHDPVLVPPALCILIIQFQPFVFIQGIADGFKHLGFYLWRQQRLRSIDDAHFREPLLFRMLSCRDTSVRIVPGKRILPSIASASGRQDFAHADIASARVSSRESCKFNRGTQNPSDCSFQR